MFHGILPELPQRQLELVGGSHWHTVAGFDAELGVRVLRLEVSDHSTDVRADEGEVVAENVDPYAISFVAFYCTQEAAQDAADAFPSNGRGGGQGQ